MQGKTLREKLADDVRAKRGGDSKPMGKNYYNSLRSTYSSEASPQKSLKIADSTQSCCQELYKACQAAVQENPPNRSPLIQWLEVTEEVVFFLVVGVPACRASKAKHSKAKHSKAKEQ